MRIAALTADFGHAVRVQELEIIGGKLPDEIEQITFANIDVDIYEAILSGLHKVGEWMAHRGIVLEDTASLPALYGAYLAQDEFLKIPLEFNSC
ncbi:MAG: O-methyltransferase [Methylobacteriaceae bacterium]|nr:O-methyltransferase [Methylobacteriaceae bacterium]